MPLIKKIANKFKYFPKSLQRQDLYQEGILGLTKALNNYQDLGHDFIAYATPYIKFEIIELVSRLQSSSTSRAVFRKEKQASNIPLEEKHPQFASISNLNPHQLWLKQTNHELF